MAWLNRPKGRSVPCNGEAVKNHRCRRGFTQPELASVAGFSIRLIQKAEASRPVHPDTLEILADALSTKTHPVFPEDLSATPKELARKVIEAFANHERQAAYHCQSFLAEDMTTFAPGDPSILPFSGERESIDGFDDLWKQMFSMIVRPDKKLILDNMQIFADGNDVVVLTKEMVDYSGDFVRTEPDPIAVVMKFERGKLIRFEDHFETSKAHASALEILGRNAADKQRAAKYTPDK